MAERVHLEAGWLSFEGRKASEQFSERFKREQNIFVSDASRPILHRTEEENTRTPPHTKLDLD